MVVDMMKIEEMAAAVYVLPLDDLGDYVAGYWIGVPVLDSIDPGSSAWLAPDQRRWVLDGAMLSVQAQAWLAAHVDLHADDIFDELEERGWWVVCVEGVAGGPVAQAGQEPDGVRDGVQILTWEEVLCG